MIGNASDKINTAPNTGRLMQRLNMSEWSPMAEKTINAAASILHAQNIILCTFVNPDILSVRNTCSAISAFFK